MWPVICLLTLAEVISFARPSETCPKACTCDEKSANCAGLGYKQVPANFSSATTYINLRLNAIDVVWPEDFEGLENLLTLDLRHNRLEEIYKNDFRYLKNLEELRLDYNQLDLWDSNMFIALKDKLKVLSLSHNDLSGKLSRAVFNKLGALRYLDLSYNSIDAFQSKSFPPSLTHLNLSHNPISVINRNAFKGLESLRYLDMRDLKMTSLEEQYFVTCASLDTLMMGDEYLSSISSGTFAGLDRIQSLSFTDSNVALLPEYLFEDLSTLKSLKLSGNEKLTLTAGLFSPLTNLEELFLDGIGLKTISFLPSFLELKSLVLAQNDLSVFPPLDGLKGVEMLDVSNNLMRSLTSTAGLDSLRQLNISGNSISDVEEAFFANFPSMRSVDLSSNVLTHLESRWFRFNPHLIEIITGSNPWSCDCAMATLRTTHDERNISLPCRPVQAYSWTGRRNYGAKQRSFCILCRSPFQFKGVNFNKLPGTAFEGCLAGDNNTKSNASGTGTTEESGTRQGQSYDGVVHLLIPIFCSVILLLVLSTVVYYAVRKRRLEPRVDKTPEVKSRSNTGPVVIPGDDGFEHAYATVDLQAAVYMRCEDVPYAKKSKPVATDRTHRTSAEPNPYESIPVRHKAVAPSQSNPYILPESVPGQSSLPPNLPPENPYLTAKSPDSETNPAPANSPYSELAPPPLPPDAPSEVSIYQPIPDPYLQFDGD